jgi:hypothetical protein
MLERTRWTHLIVTAWPLFFFLGHHARGASSSVRSYAINQALSKKRKKKIIHSSCAHENEALVGRDENEREKSLSCFCLYIFLNGNGTRFGKARIEKGTRMYEHMKADRCGWEA